MATKRRRAARLWDGHQIPMRALRSGNHDLAQALPEVPRLRLMTSDQLELLQANIDARSVGDTFDLRGLWGGDWEQQPNKQALGMAFKKAIKDGSLLRVVHDHLSNSPRRDIYRRV
jgi:hypothetical protein